MQVEMALRHPIVVTGIRPENDGTIHLDYTSEVSLLNAVEILPADSGNLLPVRITASPYAITGTPPIKRWSLRSILQGEVEEVTISRLHGKRPQIAAAIVMTELGAFRYDIPVATPGSIVSRWFFL